jgi:16S rRNA (uracil1498-N3)-methyltransferase
MSNPRVLVLEALSAGARLRLEADRARHLKTVLRLDAGDAVRVFNGRDGEWRARIETADKRGLALRVEEFLRVARATPDLDLLFAPVKRHATDLIVEKATELGVRRLRPVLTARTIAETVRVDRLALIAREAAEQSDRFDAPEILPPSPLAKALDGWDTARTLIYADEARGDAGGEGERMMRPILDALRDRSLQGEAKLATLTGPEGGFEPSERRLLRSLPFVLPVSLGPRILRAETAAIAALAVVQAASGDWCD